MIGKAPRKQLAPRIRVPKVVNVVEIKPIFPIEILMKIFAFLDSVKDIKNCMLLSRGIREAIYRTPEIMIKFQINSDLLFDDWRSGSAYIQRRGKFLRNIKFGVFNGSKPLIGFIFNQTTNLEALTFEDRSSKNVEQNVERVELLKLKTLKINLKDLPEFISCISDVKSLRKLSISFRDLRNQEILEKFTNQQTNLKKFELIEIENDSDATNQKLIFNFPVNFKLAELKIHTNSKNPEFTSNFLLTQTECLEKLDLKSSTNLQIKTLKCLIQEDLIIDLDSLIGGMPNIESLKCKEIETCGGTFDKMTTLEVETLDLGDLKDVKFPNLKNLTITLEIKECDKGSWNNFAGNIPNVQNIWIQAKDWDENYKDLSVLCLFKNLRRFQKLRNFSLRTFDDSSVKNDPSKMFDNEKVDFSVNFFKVLVNTDLKTANVSHYIVVEHEKILIDLLKNFEGFKFSEFCFDRIRIRRIDPKKYQKCEAPAKRPKIS